MVFDVCLVLKLVEVARGEDAGEDCGDLVDGFVFGILGLLKRGLDGFEELRGLGALRLVE